MLKQVQQDLIIRNTFLPKTYYLMRRT